MQVSFFKIGDEAKVLIEDLLKKTNYDLNKHRICCGHNVLNYEPNQALEDTGVTKFLVVKTGFGSDPDKVVASIDVLCTQTPDNKYTHKVVRFITAQNRENLIQKKLKEIEKYKIEDKSLDIKYIVYAIIVKSLENRVFLMLKSKNSSLQFFAPLDSTGIYTSKEFLDLFKKDEDADWCEIGHDACEGGCSKPEKLLPALVN